MKRDVDILDITDGKKYQANDMVKISCDDCRGCSDCCRQVEDTIVLDPYDIYNLTKGLGKSFDELLSGWEGYEPVIELNIKDSLLLPNIKMHSDGRGCSLLSEEGRCTVHTFRPGFCRLYPLGRLYEDGGFSYIHQIHECPYPNKSKVKVKKWLGIPSLPAYEKYALSWHDFLEKIREEIKAQPDTTMVSKMLTGFLSLFYRKPYDADDSFYEQIYERMDSI